MFFSTSNLLTQIITVSLICLFGFFLFGLSFFLFKKHFQEKEKIPRSLDTITFKIEVPKEKGKKEEEIRDTKELTQIYLGVAEQFFASLYNIKEEGFKNIISGQHHLSFEIATKGEEISFYLEVPFKFKDLMEKQIHSYYPESHIEEIKGYNIFTSQAHAVAAQLTLKKSHIYPIKTYKSLETDPLNGITNALSKLGKDDGAAIQIIIRPAGEKWRKSAQNKSKQIQEGKTGGFDASLLASKTSEGLSKVLGSVSNPSQAVKTQNKDIKEPVKLTPSQEATVSALDEKASKVGFETVIRCVASSVESQQKAQMYLTNIINAFVQFNSPELNSFKVAKIKNNNDLVNSYIFRYFTGPKVILNSEELASIFHFPNILTDTPNIDWLLSKKASPPSYLPEEGPVLGESIYRGVKNQIRISPRDRRQHMYVIGKSGVGKSTLLREMIKYDIKDGKGVGVIDPHGDLIEDILSIIPKERAEDVILFDPSDTERPMGLNLLEYKTPAQKDFLIQEAISIFQKLFDPTGTLGIVGPQWEHWMRNAALTVMADPKGGTLIEIPRIFTDTDFQKSKLAYVDDPQVRQFWTKQMAATSEFHRSEMLNYFVSKFGRFMTNEMMRNIIGQRKSAFNIREVMDSGKILLVNLSRGKIGDVNSDLLGMILVSKIQMAAMNRADIPEKERKDFYLYVDEFQNFATDSFATILSQARKYHLNLITANQYMAQLEEQIRDAVFGNIGTLICFRMGASDAEFLTKEFHPVFTESDLVNIDKYNTFIKLLIDGTASRPFSMQTVLTKDTESLEVASAIKELSRLKYGKDKKNIDKEIKKDFEFKGTSEFTESSGERIS